jgi:hypothetical protein
LNIYININPKMKKMLKSRKALSTSTIVKLILGLVILVAFLYFQYGIVKVDNDSRMKKECKEALRISSATKIKGNDFLQTVVGGEDRQVSDVPCKIVNKEITGNEDAAKAELALSLYNSWDMMHKGELDLFSGKSGEERYCILTHHITFKGTPNINGFSAYLTNNDIPSTTEKMKYAEYLKCFNTDTKQTSLSLKPADDIVIDTNKEYGIMFVYSKKGYMHKIWKAGTTGLVGGAIGGGAGFVLGTVLLFMPEPSGLTKLMALTVLGGTVGGAASGTYGYATGSDESADWEACVILFPYNVENLRNFNCTYMPGVQGAR